MCTDNILKLGDFGIARVLNSDTELVNTVVSDSVCVCVCVCVCVYSAK